MANIEANIPKTPSPSTPSPTPSEYKSAHSSLGSLEEISLSSMTLENRRKNKMIIVSISGSTSSGKTTLTSLLAEIFGNLPHKDGQKTKVEIQKPNEGQSGEEVAVAVVHQDDYFFTEKGMNPLATYWSSDKDYAFTMNSLAVEGSYLIETDGTRPLDNGFEDSASTTVRPKLVDRFFQSSSSNTRRNALEGNGQVSMRVTGPDCDNDKSIRFTALVQDLGMIRAGGKPLHLRVSGSAMKRDVRFETEKQASSTTTLAVEYAELIHEQQQQVLTFFDLRKKNVDFCFVEGFLLLKNPKDESNTSKDTHNLEKLEALAQSKMDRLDEITASAEQEDGIVNSELEAERDRVEKELYAHGILAKELMQSSFDVKLFLPTSKDVAKDRRFSRSMYMDPPEGSRLPGQMWKSEGYFEGVAWKNFADSHEWLHKNDPDVSVRPLENADVKYTVEWAVDRILAKIGY